MPKITSTHDAAKVRDDWIRSGLPKRSLQPLRQLLPDSSNRRNFLGRRVAQPRQRTEVAEQRPTSLRAHTR